MTRLRLAFMGTSEFAVPSLQALLAADHDILCVYSQPARPSGRGHRVQLSPVHYYAQSHNLLVRTPQTFKTVESQDEFHALKCDAAVVCSYGLLLPKPILMEPRLGCINIHASLLPRWRGASPIHHALLAGDSETGVTIMQLDKGLDTGPVILTSRVSIVSRITAQELHDQLALLGAQLIIPALSGLADQTLTPYPQSQEGITYAPKLDRSHGRIDWSMSAVSIERQIRALMPWPGSWFEYHGERIKVIECELLCPMDSDHSVAPAGCLLDNRMTVACGTGMIRLVKVQRPGRKIIDGQSFLHGIALDIGSILI